MTKYIYHSERTKTTCNECKKHDGKVFYDVKDIPKLPIHPNCKCWIETVEDKKPSNSSCDCTDMLEVAINGINNVIQNAKSLLESVDSKSNDLEIDFETIAKLSESAYLKKDEIQKEVGAHTKSCKNNVDGLYKEITQNIINIELLNKKQEEISNKLYELRRNIASVKKEAEDNLVDIETLKDFSYDPTYHTKEECKLSGELKPLNLKTKGLSERVINNSEEFNKIKSDLNNIKNAIKSAQTCLKTINERKQVGCGCKVSNAPLREEIKESEYYAATPQKTTKNAPPKTKEEIAKDNSYFSDETLKRARSFLHSSEGLSVEAYRDIAGIWTIGYGHTGYVNGKPVSAGMKITKEEAETIYRKDFEAHSNALKAVTVPLTENQKIALASFIYNNGVGAFETSTLLKKLNAGDIKGAADEFDVWVKAKNPKTGVKEVSQGLVNRRKREKELFLTPDE